MNIEILIKILILSLLKAPIIEYIIVTGIINIFSIIWDLNQNQI